MSQYPDEGADRYYKTVNLELFTYDHISPEYLAAMQSDQSQYLWTGEENWTIDKLRDYVSGVIADPNQEMFAVMQHGRHIGNIKITLDPKNRTCGYGRLFWVTGQGTGTETLRQMINYVFLTYPKVDVITDMAAGDNIASIISNLKAGMRIMGFWRNKLCIKGRRMDGIPVGITRNEWQKAYILQKPVHQSDPGEDGGHLERWEMNF